MIYTITLNPAIDNVIQIKDKLISGHNNRIVKKSSDVGGKGTHVSIALTLLDEPNICTGITGAGNYEQLQKLLREYNVEGHFQTVQGEKVRQNYVLTDTSGSSSYMITEYGSPISRSSVDALFARELADVTEKDYAVVSGNPSLKTDIEDFRYFLGRLKQTKAKIIADVSGKFLKEMLKLDLFLIKPNEFEFSEIIGEDVHEPLTCYNAYKQHADLLKNVAHVGISMGCRGSILISGGQAYSFEIAKVHTVNDTGSGDAYLSGMIYGLVNGFPPAKVGALAASVGAAKAEMDRSSGFKPERVQELVPHIKYEEINH